MAAELRRLRTNLEKHIVLAKGASVVAGTLSPRSGAHVIENARIPILRALTANGIKFDVSLNDMSGPKAAEFLREQVSRAFRRCGPRAPARARHGTNQLGPVVWACGLMPRPPCKPP